MRKWRAVSAGLAIVLLTLAVVMVLRILSITQQTSQFEDQLDSVNAGTIHSLVNDIREISLKDSNPYYRVLLFMLLLQEAWYFPDESVSPLTEAMASGEEIYWDYERAREMVGPELAFAYLYAGLPAQLDDWQAQVIAQEPHKRYRLRFLQAAGKLLSDDLLSARQLVDQELEVGANTPRGKGFALLCYMMLEDYQAAAALELDPNIIATFDLNQQLAYAELLVRGGEYLAAVEQYTTLIKQSDFSPERHFELAVPMAALSGMGHPQVQAELVVAAKSTRQKKSLAGTQAALLSELLRFNIEGNWNTELDKLTLAHPTDFWVQAAFLETQLEVLKHTLSSSTNGKNRELTPGDFSSRKTLLALAGNAHEQQWACLLQATLSAYGYQADPALNYDGLDNSLLWLKRALGDPNTTGAIASTRIPDYEMVVLDPVINQLRSTHPDYNAGVNHAVVDYLRRVQSLYTEVIAAKQLDYRIQ